MSQATSISWTDVTWGPVHGCSIVSTECRHCYAATLSQRYKHTLKPWTPANAAENVLLKPHKLREPFSNAKHWRGLGDAARRAGKTDGKLVFVNSMSDLFHEQIPDEYIARVFAVMAVADRHTYQVLTKRPERMRDLLNTADFKSAVGQIVLDQYGHLLRDHHNSTLRGWPLPNVWLGVSIGLRHFNRRADLLRATPAAERFISAEPLLGPLVETTRCDGDELGPCDCGMLLGYGGLDLAGISWVITGGESGPGHRPMDLDWCRDLRDVCIDQGVAYFHKQHGGSRPGGPREIDGVTWDEFPTSKLRVAA